MTCGTCVLVTDVSATKDLRHLRPSRWRTDLWLISRSAIRFLDVSNMRRAPPVSSCLRMFFMHAPCMCSHATAPLSPKGSPHMICLNGEDMAISRSPSKKHTPDGPPFTNSMVPQPSDPTFATKVWATTSPRSQRLHTHGRRRSTAVPDHKLEEIDQLVLVGQVQIVRSRPSRTSQGMRVKDTAH